MIPQAGHSKSRDAHHLLPGELGGVAVADNADLIAVHDHGAVILDPAMRQAC